MEFAVVLFGLASVWRRQEDAPEQKQVVIFRVVEQRDGVPERCLAWFSQ